MTYIASTSLSFFWELINSQINYCYLPLMSVNPPGQVSFYFDILAYICTFDPIPMDIVYEVVPVWDFNQVTEANDKPTFSRIGMSDRNIIDVLGSLFFIIVLFIVSQLIYKVLNFFKEYSYIIR